MSIFGIVDGCMVQACGTSRHGGRVLLEAVADHLTDK